MINDQEKEYQVWVDDNFHYMDPSERTLRGSYGTLEEAEAECRRMVEDNLRHLHEPTMTAEALYSQYVSFGEDPFVVGGTTLKSTFSAWKYAEALSKAVCADREA